MSAGSNGRADWADLLAQERLPATYAATVERWWRPLAQVLAAEQRAKGAPLAVGISGAQGSGKSTVCRFLEVLLAGEGLRAVTLSLDDFYLGRAERQALAARLHPLLATRGVPGTHDVAALAAALQALTGGKEAVVRLPRFDKGADDRRPVADWTQHHAPADVVLLEGWCVGATPQPDGDLADPINALEADEDADRRWRAQVNAQLAGPYGDLFARLDMLVALVPPDFASVIANRRLQEDKLAQSAGADRAMSPAALSRFMAHYERLTRHMLRHMPGDADVVVRLGAGQRITDMLVRAGQG